VREAIQLLQKIFRLRTCEDSVFQNVRALPAAPDPAQPAPCVGLIDSDSYGADVKNVSCSCRGGGRRAADPDKMRHAAEALRYEQAAPYRTDQAPTRSRNSMQRAAPAAMPT
jgi:excinuclease ABC subunit C